MQRKGVMTLKSQAIKTNQAEKQRDKKQQKKKKNRNSVTNREMPRYLICMYLKLSIKKKSVSGAGNFQRNYGSQKFSRLSENCTHIDPRNKLKQK